MPPIFGGFESRLASVMVRKFVQFRGGGAEGPSVQGAVTPVYPPEYQPSSRRYPVPSQPWSSS